MSVHERLVSVYDLSDKVLDFYRFLQWEHKATQRYDVDLPTRLKAWRHGFDSTHWIWLDMHNRAVDPSEYVNTIHSFRILPHINGAYSGVLNDKIAFHRASGPMADCLPDLYGTINNGTFHAEDADTPRTLSGVVDRNETVMVKPICGGSGDGVHKLESDGEGYLVNGDATSATELVSKFDEAGEYMVTEYVDQHEYSNAVYPHSTNTIRIITVIDPKTHEAEVVGACHRFGTSRSKPTDNWSRGGICAAIDVETGVMQDGIDPHHSDGITRTEVHPETGGEISGVQIPNWEGVLSTVRQLANTHDRAVYVGWDVILTADAEPVVIEANSNPGIFLPQMDHGLFEYDAVRRLFDSLDNV